MKRLVLVLGLIAFAARSHAADAATFEAGLAAEVASPKITVVHLWAPWCPNCKAELANHGWSNFIAANPDVNFVFVTVWSEGDDGRALLARNGVGDQPNLRVLPHPNGSRKKEDKMTALLGLPVSWIPSTWVYRAGTLRYALNYGELRFPLLQQLIRDTGDKWQH